jgi:hypothetical protein
MCVTGVNINPIRLVEEKGGNMSVGDEKDMFLKECDVVGKGLLRSVKE